MTPNNALKSKQDLFQILKWCKMLSNANTIGETHINGNTPTRAPYVFYLVISFNAYSAANIEALATQ